MFFKLVLAFLASAQVSLWELPGRAATHIKPPENMQKP